MARSTANRYLPDGVSLMVNCHLDPLARDVCDVCGKVAFQTQESAEGRAAEINSEQPPLGLTYSAYAGDCGYWHLTTIWTELLRGCLTP